MTLGPLDGVRVVDLFAGSGAMGIEALSRGAAFADFAECARPALTALEENLSRLDLLARAQIWRTRLPRGLGRMVASLSSADLVLIDPPYGGDLARATLRALGMDGVLRPGRRVVVEHHAKDVIPDASGRLHRTGSRRYGETAVTLFEVRAAGAITHEETTT